MIFLRVRESLVGGGYVVYASSRSLTFYLKLVLVLTSMTTYLIPFKPYPYLLSLLSITLLLHNRRFKLVILILINALILLSLLIPVSILFGQGIFNAVNYTLYVITSLSAIMYVAVTTSPSEAEKYLKIEGVARFATLVYALKEEVLMIYETFKARGFEIGLNFKRTIPPLITILVNTIDRMITLEESLKARGYTT